MLVLSRKLKQEIQIGDNVVITVLKVKGNTVQLGIEAPRDIKIMRGELPKRTPDSSVKSDKADPSPEMADFTIVFSNSNDDNSAQLDVIPFESRLPHASSQSDGTLPPARRFGSAADSITQKNLQPEPDSIRFRRQIPLALQHNRLKEIVKQLTAKQ